MLKDMLDAQTYLEADDMDTYRTPKIGYIAMIGKEPVAAGFLRRVEGDVIAQIDGLTSNPYFGSLIRHKGISEVLSRLVEDAKELKLKGLIAFCQDQTMVDRAKSIDFKQISHTTLALSLK